MVPATITTAGLFPLLELVEMGAGFGDEAGGGITFPRFGHVEHEIGNLGARGWRWLGGADVHPAIDLHGIDGQEGGGAGGGARSEARGEGFREIAFAGGGASENHDGFHA